MTNAEYKLVQGWIDSIYDMLYNKAEQIEESGNVSEFLELKDWVSQKHMEVISKAKMYHANDKVLDEIDYDFNYLLNELDDAINEN